MSSANRRYCTLFTEKTLTEHSVFAMNCAGPTSVGSAVSRAAVEQMITDDGIEMVQATLASSP